MRLIHEVIDDPRHAPPEPDDTPMGAVVAALLDGERGSLRDLADRFLAAGLGGVMASWMGAGPHQPIPVAQLYDILGRERVEDMATLAGLAPGEMLARLAQLLPDAVHALARADA